MTLCRRTAGSRCWFRSSPVSACTEAMRRRHARSRRPARRRRPVEGAPAAARARSGKRRKASRSATRRSPPLPGARADFGRLGGTVYQIEMPRDWNGRLVLYMHGFEELGPEAQVTAPDFRRYLIGHGYAWGASSFSSTSLIPGRVADETAALWDFFARKYGRPRCDLRDRPVDGRHGDPHRGRALREPLRRRAGAVRQRGPDAGGGEPRPTSSSPARTPSGVTQARVRREPATSHKLIHDRILPALRDPDVHRRFEDIMIALTGGPRAFDREGFDVEEETNWRRAELTRRRADRAEPRHRVPARSPEPPSRATSSTGRSIRLPIEPRSCCASSSQATRRRAGSGCRCSRSTPPATVRCRSTRRSILQRRVDAAGQGRACSCSASIRDPSHCGFTTAEQAAGFEALVRWVEHGVKPNGHQRADPPTCASSTERSSSRRAPARRPTRFRVPPTASPFAATPPSTASRSTRSSWARSFAGADSSPPASASCRPSPPASSRSRCSPPPRRAAAARPGARDRAVDVRRRHDALQHQHGAVAGEGPHRDVRRRVSRPPHLRARPRWRIVPR